MKLICLIWVVNKLLLYVLKLGVNIVLTTFTDFLVEAKSQLSWNKIVHLVVDNRMLTNVSSSKNRNKTARKGSKFENLFLILNIVSELSVKC